MTVFISSAEAVASPRGHLPTNINTLCATWPTCWGAMTAGGGDSLAFMMFFFWWKYPPRPLSHANSLSASRSSFKPVSFYLSLFRSARLGRVSVSGTALKRFCLQPSTSSLRKRFTKPKVYEAPKHQRGSLKYYWAGFYNCGHLSQPHFTQGGI